MRSKSKAVRSSKKSLPEFAVYVLLDRTGSMATRWAETLKGLNEYVKKVGQEQPSAHFTVAAFDEQGGLQFDILRDGVHAKSWHPITDADATPRGCTPLYDALVRLVTKAEAAQPARAVVVVVTDGQENASREVTKEQAKAALDRCKAKSWQVVFLGADFDAFAQAQLVGVNAQQVIETSAGNYGKAFAATAQLSTAYASRGQAMCYSQKDRAQAIGEDDQAE